jgi:predicted nucleic acid-binding protein
MIVLDASGVVALLDRRDRCYDAALAAVKHEPGPFVVPMAVLADVDALLAARGSAAMPHLLASVADGSLVIDAGAGDLARIRDLLAGGGRRSFADAAVVACAERNRARVLTFAPDGYTQLLADGNVSLVELVRAP